MAFIHATMVGSNDDNGLVVDASGLQGLNKTAYEHIEFGQRLVVFWCIMTNGMTSVVELIPTNSKERGFAIDNETLCHLAE